MAYDTGVRLCLHIPDATDPGIAWIEVEGFHSINNVQLKSESYSTSFFLITLLAEVAVWNEYNPPGPKVEIKSFGGSAGAALWIDTLFRQKGPIAGARELFEATGLLDEPLALSWVL